MIKYLLLVEKNPCPSYNMINYSGILDKDSSLQFSSQICAVILGFMMKNFSLSLSLHPTFFKIDRSYNVSAHFVTSMPFIQNSF